MVTNKAINSDPKSAAPRSSSLCFLGPVMAIVSLPLT